METVAARELLAEVRRRLSSADPTERETILDGIVFLVRDHRHMLFTGPMLDLASLLEEEADRRFKEEAAIYAGTAAHNN